MNMMMGLVSFSTLLINLIESEYHLTVGHTGKNMLHKRCAPETIMKPFLVAIAAMLI